LVVVIHTSHESGRGNVDEVALGELRLNRFPVRIEYPRR